MVKWNGTNFQRLNPWSKNSDGTSLTGVVAISTGSDHTVYLGAMAPSGRRGYLKVKLETARQPIVATLFR